MNKNILFSIIMLFVVIASVSSVSAWWIFGGGNDVTVNGVDFHLPEGFDADNPINAESDATYGRAVYKNSENGNTIDIAVDDQSVDESVIENSLIKKGFEAKNIAGKDGFYNF